MDGEKHAVPIAALPDPELIARLQAGDENTFTQLVDHYNASMVRIAAIYVNEFAIAEEVVQDTWIAVLKGLDRFEGRSSFKTWIFTILSNRAKTRATRESRFVPLDTSDEPDDQEGSGHIHFIAAGPNAGGWADDSIPHLWESVPEAQLLGQETRSIIFHTIESLSPNQQQVIRLRDVDGFSAEEVCNMLQLSESNQRVLLHRARERVRQALDTYFAQE
ncbi:MAG: sigma-70 family RNA polymerase sigma factor [Chloroflexota bacterium]